MDNDKDIKYFDSLYSKQYWELSLKKAMSLSRVKKSIRDFDMRFSSVAVAILCGKEDKGDECPRAKAMVRWFLFDGGADDFAEEMGMLADLHCIVKIGNGIIWVRRAMDTKELNIDDKVLNRMLKWFKTRKVKEE